MYLLKSSFRLKCNTKKILKKAKQNSLACDTILLNKYITVYAILCMQQHHIYIMQCINKMPIRPWAARHADDAIDSVTYSIQVFEDPTEKIVDFSPINIWQIGEENIIEYTLPFGYEEAENDWIGVYKVLLKKAYDDY